MSKAEEIIEVPQVNTTSQIQDLLTTFVELSGLAYVDTDGYIRLRSQEGEDKYVELLGGIDKEMKYLTMYSDNIKNFKEVVVLNPFTETITLTPDREWFYSTLLNNTLSLNSLWLFNQVMTTALERKATVKPEEPAKGKKGKKTKAVAKPQVKESLADIELISPLLTFVTDEKMLDEFNTVVTNISDSEFLNVFYSKSTKTAKIHCALLNPDLEAAYPKIRKQTWQNWKNILEVIYGDLNKNYTVRADLIGCPQLDATLKCWHTLFTQAGKYYKFIGIDLDVDKLKTHIDNLQVYHSKAKWLSQVAVAPTSTSTKPSVGETTKKPSITGGTLTTSSGLKITDVPDAITTTAPMQPAAIMPQQTSGLMMPAMHPAPAPSGFAQPLTMYPSQMNTASSPYGSGMRLPTLNLPQPGYGTQVVQTGGLRIDMNR